MCVFLPICPCSGHKYEGVKFEKGNCGVSIMRSGELVSEHCIWNTHTALFLDQHYPAVDFLQHFVCVCVCVGEAMEQGLRDCCRSIRIGKILIQSDEETQKAKVFYAKFPPDINRRKVLLMYPILSEYLSQGSAEVSVFNLTKFNPEMGELS